MSTRTLEFNTTPVAKPMDTMTLNMGPHHPSTHGVFRMDVYRGGCTTAAVCSGALDRYSWYTDFADSPHSSTATGECQCRTTNTPGYNLCRDNSSVFHVRVYRDSSAAPDCAEYALRITNGVF